MKVSVEKQALLIAMAHVGGVAAKSQASITSNVLISVVGGGITIEGTDLDMVATAVVPADIAASGGGPNSITVSSAYLHEIANKSPKGAVVQLSWNDRADAAKVVVGRSTFTLGILPADSWISFDRGSPIASFTIGAREIAAGLQFVRGGAGDSGKGWDALAGVLFDNEAGRLRFAATDGKIIRVADTEASAPLPIMERDEPVSITVPTRAVDRIIRLAEASTDDVTIQMDARKLTAATASLSLCSKLLDSRFPDYRRAIPSATFRVLSDRAELLDAIQRIAFLAGKSPSMKISIGESEMVVSIHTIGQETATSSLGCEMTDHAPIDVYFSHRYVAPVLDALDGDTIEIGMRSAMEPAIFRCLGAPGRFSVIGPRNG